MRLYRPRASANLNRLGDNWEMEYTRAYTLKAMLSEAFYQSTGFDQNPRGTAAST